MTEFTASNGLKIKANENEHHPVIVASLGLLPTSVIALREFFQHERDEELGRWRWPEDLDYVVYSNPDEAFERMFGPNLDLVILRESDGMTKGYVRDEDQGGPPMDHRVGHMLAARAYFEAHPERKPWRSAEAGEVWVLTYEGQDHAFGFDSRDERFVYASGETWFPHDDPGITAGRRIWPEDAS
ncbi:hypothetical protein NS234_01800 [Microbacterium oxydans]|uniref:hypothetical protein n=1 Tax=Microbacterium oxydans TaxID=82380 RepID=UPI0007344300|nr:hypothetical protein [Microbacterium oxydans]KTR79132.1 hypothetical protein NS234_01800 [Microbacterium oxydans]